MYLIIDCETTGLPKKRDAELSDLDSWPRIVQLAWALYDEKEKEMETRNYLIRPDGFEIPEEAFRVHGITTEKARDEGKDIAEILRAFSATAARAKFVVAHNLEFDKSVIETEYIRLKLQRPKEYLRLKLRRPLESGSPKQRRHFSDENFICTMKQSKEYCKIPGKYGFKWPSLLELHEKLFGKGYDEMHDAGADVAACAHCFFELKRRGVITA